VSNILMLCDTFAPSLGGSEKMLLDLARGLAGQGHTITVLTPSAEGDHEFDQGEPYTIRRSRLWGKLFKAGLSTSPFVNRAARLLIVPVVLRLALTCKNVDVVLVGHVLPLGTVAAAMKQLRPAVRSIVMTYGEDVTVYSRGSRMRGMLRSALLSADAITCLTSDSAAEIRGLVAPAAPVIAIIPPSVQDGGDAEPQWVEALRRQHQLENRRVILTLSRIVPRKGFDVTLRAVKLLKAEFPDLVYVIAGRGPDLPRLQQLIGEWGLEDSVRYVSDCPPFPASKNIYGLCDVFCMPNRQMPDGEREGFGIVFLEAALAGKPVIAGRSGGAPDAVIHEETGLVVDPESEEEVAAAIRRLLTDTAFAALLARAARHRALSQFTLDQFVSRYQDLWADLPARSTASK
jgi:phosphatidylinositol alpha-1,6-mannosyltransferase